MRLSREERDVGFRGGRAGVKEADSQDQKTTQRRNPTEEWGSQSGKNKANKGDVTRKVQDHMQKNDPLRHEGRRKPSVNEKKKGRPEARKGDPGREREGKKQY